MPFNQHDFTEKKPHIDQAPVKGLRIHLFIFILKKLKKETNEVVIKMISSCFFYWHSSWISIYNIHSILLKIILSMLHKVNQTCSLNYIHIKTIHKINQLNKIHNNFWKSLNDGNKGRMNTMVTELNLSWYMYGQTLINHVTMFLYLLYRILI